MNNSLFLGKKIMYELRMLMILPKKETDDMAFEGTTRMTGWQNQDWWVQRKK